MYNQLPKWFCSQKKPTFKKYLVSKSNEKYLKLGDPGRGNERKQQRKA